MVHKLVEAGIRCQFFGVYVTFEHHGEFMADRLHSPPYASLALGMVSLLCFVCDGWFDGARLWMMSEGLWSFQSQSCSLTCLHRESAGLHIHFVNAQCLALFFFLGEHVCTFWALVKTDVLTKWHQRKHTVEKLLSTSCFSLKVDDYCSSIVWAVNAVWNRILISGN